MLACSQGFLVRLDHDAVRFIRNRFVQGKGRRYLSELHLVVAPGQLV